jgi:hypothetical protein
MPGILIDWKPTKPLSEYSDVELRQTPPYKQITAYAQIDDHYGLRLTRDCITQLEQALAEEARIEDNLKAEPDISLFPYENASRRTKQRWSAHITGRCNLTCRFCRREDSQFHQWGDTGDVSLETGDVSLAGACLLCGDQNAAFCGDHITGVTTTQAATAEIVEAEVDEVMTADEVLTEVVADELWDAAQLVAATKAKVEINQEALIQGMLVWHRFGHYPCILLEDMSNGFWMIQTKDGDIERQVRGAILTPVKPNIFKRVWASLKHRKEEKQEQAAEAAFQTARLPRSAHGGGSIVLQGGYGGTTGNSGPVTVKGGNNTEAKPKPSRKMRYALLAVTATALTAVAVQPELLATLTSLIW